MGRVNGVINGFPSTCLHSMDNYNITYLFTIYIILFIFIHTLSSLPY